jgi:serine/threonine protein kinase
LCNVFAFNFLNLLYLIVGEMTDSEQIIQFFINIFILQSGSLECGNWQRKYKLMPTGASADCTYELRISKGADVKTRRMSIRQLGVTAESKSTCYMVTYDDFLVIKIPPAPLSDFEEYLENIEVEKNIAGQLNPTITCLVPGLAAILFKIPEILEKLNQNQEASEEAYISLLKKEPKYQQYLKIGGQFVFFMELSEHAFFDQIIANIHSEKKRIREEITKSSHVFDDLVTFGDVYGSDKDDIFFSVNELCKNFHLKLDDFLSQHFAEPVVADYEKREWLFAFLANNRLEIQNESVAEFADEIGQLFDQVVDENAKTVERYLDYVRSCVRKKIFDNHRTNMEALIVKMLEMLCRLKDSGVAIRDLKPDNMLLAGKREHGQYHLSDPDQYDLGLIDLETAVAFKGSEDGLMRQPLLTGTPSYMTPSHLFSNFALIDVYGNKLSAVFCLQDWFAAVGIIFCIVTGQRLFEKTAKLLPEIVRVKKRGLNRHDPETEILKNVSRIFWKTAGDEFSEMIRTHLQRLENIHLALPDPIVNLFRSEVESAENRIHDAVEQCANSQKLFPQQAKRLISASVDAVRTQRIKWENKAPKKNVSSDIREQAIILFQQLETLKSRLKNLDDNGCLIKKTVSCEELLRFMFNMVAIDM